VFTWLRTLTDAGSCKQGNDHCGSMYREEFLDYLNVLQASQVGCCSMRFV
jgi:hypothetical protein